MMGINKLTGVFSGVTRYNWWAEVGEYHNIVQYIVCCCVKLIFEFGGEMSHLTFSFKNANIISDVLKYNFENKIIIIATLVEKD
jgi:hypothetical protein